MKAALFSLLFISPAIAQLVSEPISAPPTPPAILHREVQPVVQKSDFTGQTTIYSIGTPTDEEQLYLELINRARANPTAEGLMLAAATDPDVVGNIKFWNVDLNMMKSEFAALPVRPPLALNANLTNAARDHTQFQFDTATQTHTGSGGSDVGDRATAANYSYSSLGESTYVKATSVFHGHAGFQIDWGPGDTGGMQLGRGHRVNNHGDFREVGIGVKLGNNTVGGNTVGPQLVTQDFGVGGPDDKAFVTGVAYYDMNGNSFYDPGEGIGGLTVNVDGSSFHAVTANSGGYAVPVPTTNATRAVTFTGLGASGDASAQIVGGANVKVDFIPAYVPPSLSGPASAGVSLTTNLTHNTVLGATGYKGRSVANMDALADGADNLTRVTVVKTGAYNNISTSVKHSGTGSYRFANPGLGSQTLTYTNVFRAKAGASLAFRSRLGVATPDQVARVEVSTDAGHSWSTVYSQAGVGQPGETSFQARSVSLAAFADKDIQLRFNYSLYDGAGFFLTSDGVGWYIDTITFTNLVNLDGATITTLPNSGTFPYTPTVVGDFLLAVTPIISGRDFSFGPAKAVTVTAAPPSLAEITVEQPAPNGLTDGVSTVAFGTKMLNDDEVKTFVIRNDGSEDLTGLALSVVGTNPGDFVAANLGATSLTPGNETTFTITFTAATQGARAATLRIASNDSSENPFDINLTGTASNAPTIDAQPISLVRAEGSSASFSVTASHPTLTPTYQWRKNNVAIKNATTNTLPFAAVKATDAATYTVVVSAGGESVTSDPALLVTVKPITQLLVVVQGTSLKPTVVVTGGGTLEWKKTSGVPPVTNVIPGQVGKILPLNALDAATGSGIYQCEVSVPGGSKLKAGEFDIRVFNAKPQVTLAQNMPSGAIGIPYSHQILLNGGLDESPVTYAAKNLPTGLILNTKTGLISGVPTVAKTFAKVSVSATNSKGTTASAEQDIIIAALPLGVAGTFTGTVAREATLNTGLGGRVDLTIASTGAISGSLILGTTRLPFTGNIVIDVDPLVKPSASINVSRGAGKVPYVFALTLDNANEKFAAGTLLKEGAITAAIEGWRYVWTTVKLATAAPKLFTYALRPPAGPELPRGDGYGSFTLAKDGKLTTAGKLADGESYTSATYAGPHGQILIFQALATTKGSILGIFDIDAANDGVLDDTGLTGIVSWLRPANTRSRVYPGGFGPISLTAVGARFITPLAPALILDLVVNVDKAGLTFAEGGLAGSVVNPNVDALDILAGNKALLPALLSAGNLGSVKITALSATTGVFTGTFVVTDDEIRTGAFAGKKISRTGNFSGILTHDGISKIGAGHFLLPELPHDAIPGAVPPVKATTPTTSLLFSGSVLLKKKP
jgi:hypothetical protein